MSRVEALNLRYAASVALARSGVEIVAVGDPVGARLNTVVRGLLDVVRDDGSDFWEDLVGAAKALRWRLLTQPEPLQFNADVRSAVEQISRQVLRLRGVMAHEALLDNLLAAAYAVGETDPPVGPILLRSIEEVGSGSCLVVAASTTARAGLQSWLEGFDVDVATAGDLEGVRSGTNQAYVVGPPRFFHSSLLTAPVVEEMSFIMPAWFGDRSIPRSAIAPYADGAITIRARVFTEGDVDGSDFEVRTDEVESDFLPQFVWGSGKSADREPGSEEVVARKVILSGNLAIWLDDGDRIRVLDPAQPAGERVHYTDVGLVRAGIYLLLRRGETERGVLYQAALSLLGDKGNAAATTQITWKAALAQCLVDRGYPQVVGELRKRGVKAADRARAWTDSNLVRPNSDHDFEAMLEWLGIALQPTSNYALLVRRALYKASSEVRDQLEKAVSVADLAALEHNGHLSLDVETAGLRGILATRVLAVSPYTEIVSRHEARLPYEDRSLQWRA
ncbi:hypothetical protein EH165_05700 [Nakamurella antarctica]|uniref:Uncharacterized protein n=1 Tax=Nakamurella antarctica TaxID=1902245 RepID=A0A3G8ZLL0_9ACTN|nr:hypothetical protein [Nakamurella antarctica]AZI57715.1 hypothetical protein EH165_05700 [Nakamurella antarctica]